MPYRISAWRQAEGTPLFFVLPKITYELPACTKCARRLQIARHIRHSLQWLSIIGSVLVGTWLLRDVLSGPWLTIVVLGIATVAMFAHTYIETIVWPPHFDAAVDGENVCYSFRDDDYASAFSGCNSKLGDALRNIGDVLKDEDSE